MTKIQPPLRYPGSKNRAYKHIAPYVDSVDHDEFREPFFGSGGVFFGKNHVKYNWINDIDEDLMNFYFVIQNKAGRDMLVNRVKDVVPSKEFFDTLKYSTPETDWDRAFRYFVINRTAYSGIMNLPNWGFHPTKSVQPDKWPHRIKSAGEFIEDAKITCLDYETVLFSPKVGNSILFFIDPPYFNADQKRAYVKSFTHNDHVRLMENLRKLEHKFVLTYDDCEEVRKLYDWANIHEVEWMYHTANSNVTLRKKGRELIITNF